MANLQFDPNDELPQPLTSDSGSPPAKAESRAANCQHFRELIGHTLDAADYSGHGHAAGRQGARGHAMPKSDAHLQGGAYVPQNMYASNGSAQADEQPLAGDYGAVDKTR